MLAGLPVEISQQLIFILFSQIAADLKHITPKILQVAFG